jgi:histidinol-phosphate phosphatase family protein
MSIGAPAVFFDRDGTINEDAAYLAEPAQVRLLPGVAEGLRLLQGHGFRLIIVSNQSGVARGLLTEATLQAIDTRLATLLAGEGVTLAATYYCPHHPDGIPPYRLACDCRKPRSGLVERATREHDIDLGRSFVVGDQGVDIALARQVGIPAILVLTGQGKHTLDSGEALPDYVAADLTDAARWILGRVVP